jgi:hypothetical protein
MDPSVQFLLGNEVPTTSGATIHPLAPPDPVSIDEDKIGFTLDVAVRLDQEYSEEVREEAVIVPIVDTSDQDLADTA